MLYDVVALLDGDDSELRRWVAHTASTVVALTRPLRPDLGSLALELGAEAALPLSATAEQVRAVVREALAGTLAEHNGASADLHHDRLGADVGLSPRELDVLREVVNGLSNQSGRQALPQHQLGEDLHPQRLSQGRRDHPCPGRLVVRPQRLPHAATLTSRQYGGMS